jgi:hypothetical protein
MKQIFAFSLLIALCTVPSFASVVTYTDRAAFESALGFVFVEDFTGNTLHIPGLSYVSPVGQIGQPVGMASGSDQFNDQVVHQTRFTTWTLPNLATGFGANWDLSPGGPAQGIQFFLDGVTLVGSEVPSSYTGGFFGFISDTPFQSVSYDGGTQSAGVETYIMDNLTFNAPEPGTFVLAAAGLALVMLRRRRA